MTDAAARGEFALDTISWVTPRLAVTDMHGAARVFGDANFYIINTAAEIATACDCFARPLDQLLDLERDNRRQLSRRGVVISGLPTQANSGRKPLLR
mgnify:CR=1 FL=1